MRKPRIGDLVRLDDLAIAERGYWGKETAQVGVIIQCIGIRCHVKWTDGLVTKPERSVLEVINAAR